MHKFIDNFTIHKVQAGQRVVQVSFLETSIDEKSWIEEASSRLSLNLKMIHVALENRRVSGKISKEHIFDPDYIGINAGNEMKHALRNEWDVNFEKDLFEKTFSLARTLDSYSQYKGFVGRFFSLVGYKPLIWFQSNKFLYQIIKSSNDILKSTRIGMGDWIVVSPQAATRFGDLSTFVLRNGTSRSTSCSVEYFGTWKNFKIYTSWLIEKNCILMGRNPHNDHDILVRAVVGEEEWLESEGLEFAETILNIGLRKDFKIFEIPGSQNSYVKWKFEMEKPNFWKWLVIQFQNTFRFRK
jgi:hypothetical protein